MTIPKDIAAKVLFMSDRTCCVCRMKGKPIQIHHVDDDNSNDDMDNLAVLCIDCHNETQIKGGFHRKLNAEQIILYQNDWHSIVARDRVNMQIEQSANYPPKKKIEYITTLVENLRENENFDLLSMLYNSLGNIELRDKYIEKAFEKDASPSNLIHLRSIQGRIDEVKEIIEAEIEYYKKNQNWSQLARFFIEIKDPKNAVYYYCKDIMNSIDESRHFSAGYYLKEMQKENLKNALFELALSEANKENNLWWQYRSLQELGWKSEIKDFVLQNKKQIEESGNPDLIIELLKATGEEEKAHDLLIKKTNSMRIIKHKIDCSS